MNNKQLINCRKLKLKMKTVTIPNNYQHTSPAGAEVRVLMSNNSGGIAHCTLRNKKILTQPF